MFFQSFITSRPICGHLKELCKVTSVLGRYRHISSIPPHRLALIESSKISSTLFRLPPNSTRCENQNYRFFSKQSESKTDAGKKGSSKMKLLIMGFGLGALVGLGYMYKNIRHKVMPIANIDSENLLLFSEPPPIDFIAKRVILCELFYGNNNMQLYITLCNILQHYIPNIIGTRQ